MLAISRAPTRSRQTEITPNILPASIKYNGPVPFDDRYWTVVEEEVDEEEDGEDDTAADVSSPTHSQPGAQVSRTAAAVVGSNGQVTKMRKEKKSKTSTAYFRGRKLRGREWWRADKSALPRPTAVRYASSGSR